MMVSPYDPGTKGAHRRAARSPRANGLCAARTASEFPSPDSDSGSATGPGSGGLLVLPADPLLRRSVVARLFAQVIDPEKPYAGCALWRAPTPSPATALRCIRDRTKPTRIHYIALRSVGFRCRRALGPPNLRGKATLVRQSPSFCRPTDCEPVVSSAPRSLSSAHTRASQGHSGTHSRLTTPK